MRSPREDVELIGRAGWWEDDEPLMNAVVQLLKYAKSRHKPVHNLHKLAKAVENGDGWRAQEYYVRLHREVADALVKYPDIAGGLANP